MTTCSVWDDFFDEVSSLILAWVVDVACIHEESQRRLCRCFCTIIACGLKLYLQCVRFRIADQWGWRWKRHHMLLKWPGRWIRRAVPTSGFLNFVNLDRFGVAEAPLNHFVTHVNIARFLVQTRLAPLAPSLVPPFWHTKSPTQQLYPILFLSTVLRVVQAYSAWYSAHSQGSPPTDIRRRPVLRLARP